MDGDSLCTGAHHLLDSSLSERDEDLGGKTNWEGREQHRGGEFHKIQLLQGSRIESPGRVLGTLHP